MSTSTYFVDLSNATFSLNVSFDEDHTSTLRLDAHVTFPKNELTQDGVDLAARRWRLAVYDQASRPGLDKPRGGAGVLRWGKDYPDEEKIGCTAQFELKTTLFSRLLNFLQSGNTISSGEITIDIAKIVTTEKGTTAPILELTLNAESFGTREQWG